MLGFLNGGPRLYGFLSRAPSSPKLQVNKVIELMSAKSTHLPSTSPGDYEVKTTQVVPFHVLSTTDSVIDASHSTAPSASMPCEHYAQSDHHLRPLFPCAMSRRELAPSIVTGIHYDDTEIVLPQDPGLHAVLIPYDAFTLHQPDPQMIVFDPELIVLDPVGETFNDEFPVYLVGSSYSQVSTRTTSAFMPRHAPLRGIFDSMHHAGADSIFRLRALNSSDKRRRRRIRAALSATPQQDNECRADSRHGFGHCYGGVSTPMTSVTASAEWVHTGPNPCVSASMYNVCLGISRVVLHRSAILVDELILPVAAEAMRVLERIPPEVWRFAILATMLPSVMAGGDKGDPSVPVFDGVTATYTSWFIAFLGWICWKRPSLTPLLDGSLARPVPVAVPANPGPSPPPPGAEPPNAGPEPAPADPANVTAAEAAAHAAWVTARDARADWVTATNDLAAWRALDAAYKAAVAANVPTIEWDGYNTQLFGAIISHVSAPLQASLYVASPSDGVGAVTYLKARYGSHSVGDRAEATARLQRSHIDVRAKLSEADLQMQFNEMSVAAADIVSAGGTRPDDALLISIFENSLPSAYSQIRQMIRYRAHTVFTDYYNDMLSQVKAELRATTAPALGAFSMTAQGGVYQVGGNGKGKGKGKGKGSSHGQGRGRGGQGGEPSDLSSNPCFNCLGADHTRDRCSQPKVKCDHCGADHHSSLCFKGPGGHARDALGYNARHAIERQSAAATSSQPQAHSATSMNALVQQYQAWRTSRGSNGSSSAAPPASSAPQSLSTTTMVTPSINAVSASSTPTDDFAEFLDSMFATATNGVNMVRSQPPMLSTTEDDSSQSVKLPGLTCSAVSEETDVVTADPSRSSHDLQSSTLGIFSLSRRTPMSVIGFVDSQASNWVVPHIDYLLRVTNRTPTVPVNTAGGPIVPIATGVVGLHMVDRDGVWHYLEVPDVLVMPSCTQVLYSQPQMALLGFKHNLDDGFITTPRGHVIPTLPNYSIELSFGPPPKPMLSAYPVRSMPLSKQGKGTDSTTTVPQSMLWQRLGFPSEHAWRHLQSVTTDHGLPTNAHLRFDFPINDAVARARTRALPFHSLRDPDDLPAPGSMLYLDFAGPMVASYPHKFTYYCGVVDAGSQYSRLFACHGPTREVARASQLALCADLRSLLGLSHPLKPHVVVTDQGSAFMSHYFRDFLSDDHVRHWPSAPYTPQQNPFVERMWGTRFAAARAMLAFANLGPAFAPYALQAANWVWNRLPLAARANLSSWFILTRRTASLAYLRTFGCLVRVLVPDARREGDRHFADRGSLGINLGPSEQSPAYCVYVPSSRKFLTSRHVVFYEDVLPGVRGVDASWRAVVSGEEGVENRASPTLTAPQPAPQPQFIELSPDTAPNSLQLDATIDVAPTADDPAMPINTAPTTVPMTSAPVAAPHQPTTQPLAAPTAPSPPQPTARQPDARPTPRLRKGDSGDPNDPQSRLFAREPSTRVRKQTDRFAFAYSNPSTSCKRLAVLNAICVAAAMGPTSSYFGRPYFAYENHVGCLGTAYAITNTADFGDVPIPRGYRQAIQSKHASYWKDAIAKELNGLIQNQTWVVMRHDDLPKDANLMSCHMVFTVKRNSDGSIEKFKCRLVANGNTQRHGVDFDRIFSTVVKVSTIRLVLAVAAARDYNLTSIDVKQAYLQAELNEDLYMTMPPGLASYDRDGHRLIVKLRKSLYGLKQAGREWGQLLTSFLVSYGFTRSSIDVCMYTFTSGSSFIWLCVWVDDCVIVDNCSATRNKFISALDARFPLTDKGDLEWILGVKITRNRQRRTLDLSQELYVRDLVKRFGSLMEGLTKRFDSPVDSTVCLSSDQCPAHDSPEAASMAAHHDDYMSLVGAFLWLSNVTRPELSYITSQLARFVSNPGRVHYNAALRVLLYLDGSSQRTLHYAPKASLGFQTYVDSNWDVKFSISGAIFVFMGCAIHWFSKTQRSVSLSSTEAEFFAAMMAARDCVQIREVLIDLGLLTPGPSIVRSDNKSVIDLSLDAIAFKKTKHIMRAAEFLRDLCLRSVLTLRWISGENNPADIFTKGHTLAAFRAYMHILDALDKVA